MIGTILGGMADDHDGAGAANANLGLTSSEGCEMPKKGSSARRRVCDAEAAMRVVVVV